MSTLRLKVGEADARDAGRGLARIDPADMTRLDLRPGDIVEIAGKRTTVAKVLPVARDKRGQARLHIDGLLRENAGASLDQTVTVRKATPRPAGRLVLSPVGVIPRDRDLSYLAGLLDGRAVLPGDRVRANLFGSRPADFKVAHATPDGPVLIHAGTALMAAVLLRLGVSTLLDWPRVALALVAAGLILTTRVNSVWLMLGAAVLGLTASLAGWTP